MEITKLIANNASGSVDQTSLNTAMEMSKLMANNSLGSVDRIPENNNIFDKDGKRETEKTIIREQLLGRWLRQKQLEEEVMKDMALQWGKNSMPSKNVEATNDSSNKPRKGGNLSEDQRRELEKRVIGEEFFISLLHRKQLEEEVMTELFGEEMLQRGKDSIASDYPKVTSDTCNETLTDLQKIIHAQDKGEGSGLVPCVHDPIILNGQDGNDQSPGNDIDGGLRTGDLFIQSPPRAPNTTNPEIFIGFGRGATKQLDLNDQSPDNDTDGGLKGSLPIQHPPRAPNTTNPGMFIGFGKGSTATLKGEGSGLVPCVHDPIILNGQYGNDKSPGYDIEGGLSTGDLSIQSPPRAPNTTNPGMFIGFGRGATKPLDLNDQSPDNDTDGLMGSLPIQHPPRAPNTTNPGMFIGFGKGSTTALKGEGSGLVPCVHDPIILNGQYGNDKSRGNHTDGGLTDTLPFQRLPGAPKNTTFEMLINSGKKPMTPLANSVKECISQREFNADIPPIGGDDETVGKKISKRKRWECDLCHVITNAECTHVQHLRGKRHLAKLKALSETATPLTSDEENCGNSMQDDSLLE